MTTYNIVSLFCGCGGLDKGFKEAGFNIVASNDVWEAALKTYNHNFDHNAIKGDITEQSIKDKLIKKAENKHIHCLIGGPPCQAYSISGIRDPKDKRGQLFKDYIKVVDKLKPDFIVMENVKGILSMKQEKDDLDDKAIADLKKYYNTQEKKRVLLNKRKKLKNNKKTNKIQNFDGELKKLNEAISKITKKIKTMKVDIDKKYMEPVTVKIKRRFKECGYKDVHFKVLNAANYGVPQRRERVIFIGKRDNVDIDFNKNNSHPETTHSEKNEENKGFWKTVKDTIGYLENIDKKTGENNEEWKTLKDIIGNLDKKENNKKCWKTVKDTIGYLENEVENKDTNHIFSNHSNDMTQKIEKVNIGESLYKSYGDAFHKCDPNKPSRTLKENHGGVFLHYKNPRCMTPRELAELQSFPKDFIFKGSKSDILKQIGNAVPVGLGRAIGGHIHKLLDDYYNPNINI